MRLVTLLTDFGSASPYPAEMKGALLALWPVVIVDITHEVPAHDVAQGAYLLAAAVPAFPAGTIHVGVVDPGVGTARRALVVASGGHLLVGPDNGLLLPAARALGLPQAYAIDPGRFARRPLSPTFHGRDLFAPTAGALAAGLPPEGVGPPVPDPIDLPTDPPTRRGAVLHGRVLFEDRFGNLVTNLPGAWLEAIGESLVLTHPGGRAVVRRARTYGDGGPGELLALVGSDGTIELAVFTGRAGEAVRARAGDPVTLQPDSPGFRPP